nr:MAG: hypothetical protein [Agrocybe praecox orthocurvulavirus 1]
MSGANIGTLNFDDLMSRVQARAATMETAPMPSSMATSRRPMDLADAPSTTANVLPLITKEDSLSEVARKMERYAQVVERGASLAVWTNFQATSAKTDDPMELAEASMTLDEKEWYKFWLTNPEKIKLDWSKITKKMEHEKDKPETLRERVLAMQFIWKNTDLQAHNWHGLRTLAPEFIPLVSAGGKLLRAHNGIKTGMKNVTVLEAQEYQTIASLRGTGDALVNAYMAEMRKLTAMVDTAKKVLQAREHQLKMKIAPGTKPKQDAINIIRGRRGQRIIGVGMDEGDRPSGAGVKRKRETMAMDLEELDRLKKSMDLDKGEGPSSMST